MMVAQTQQGLQNADVHLLVRPHIAAHLDRPLTFDELLCDDPDHIAQEAAREANAAALMNVTPAMPLLERGGKSQRNPKQDVTNKFRQERYRQRIDALHHVLEVLLITWGWGVASADEMAGRWIEDNPKTAKLVAEKHGYSYLECGWVKPIVEGR